MRNTTKLGSCAYAFSCGGMMVCTIQPAVPANHSLITVSAKCTPRKAIYTLFSVHSHKDVH